MLAASTSVYKYISIKMWKFNGPKNKTSLSFHFIWPRMRVAEASHPCSYQIVFDGCSKASFWSKYNHYNLYITVLYFQVLSWCRCDVSQNSKSRMKRKSSTAASLLRCRVREGRLQRLTFNIYHKHPCLSLTQSCLEMVIHDFKPHHFYTKG